MSKPFAFPWHRLRPYKFHSFLMGIFRCLLPVVFRFRVIGRENLPESASGVILASNHVHGADPVYLGAATRMRWRFMAKSELFQKRFAATLYTHFNAFPVERGALDRPAFDFALAVLREGSCGLGIFPEGTRSPDGAPHQGKTGVAVFARRAQADVLPCAIYFEGKLGFRSRLTVRIGQVIPFAALDLGEAPNKRRSRAASDKIMAEIAALWEKGHG